MKQIAFISRPVPYECEITSRFPEAPTLLADEMELYGDLD